MSSALSLNNILQSAISETNSADENFMKNMESALVLYYVGKIDEDYILALTANGWKRGRGWLLILGLGFDAF